jgi:hypothetical protein
MPDLHPSEDLLLDLALSDVDDAARDRLTTHLALCERCRAAYATLADGVDHVLLAAPRVAPPAGFSGEVLAGMGVAGGAPATPERGTAGGRRGWLLAAGVAAGLVIGAVGSAVVLRPAEPAATGAGTPLVTAAGDQVGDVLESRYRGEPVLVVTVTDGREGATYECVLVLADGERRSAGSWEMADSAASWVVDRPEDGAEPVAVEMLAGPGRTWATASL